LDWNGNELEGSVWSLVAPIFGHAHYPFDAEKNKVALEAVKKVMTLLNDHLNGKKYLVG